MIQSLFRTSAARGLDREIEALRHQVESASGARQAALLNRLGDLYAQVDDPAAARACYGRAIDGYVAAGMTTAAAALCRKVIRRYPDVVRARATLTVLYLGYGPLGEATYALELIEDYARAATAAGQHELARESLRQMAGLVEDPSVRLRISELLHELGDELDGRELLSMPSEESQAAADSHRLDPEERWNRLLDAVLAGPEDLQRASKVRG